MRDHEHIPPSIFEANAEPTKKEQYVQIQNPEQRGQRNG